LRNIFPSRSGKLCSIEAFSNIPVLEAKKEFQSGLLETIAGAASQPFRLATDFLQNPTVVGKSEEVV
jgi:hypothetical protein